MNTALMTDSSSRISEAETRHFHPRVVDALRELVGARTKLRESQSTLRVKGLIHAPLKRAMYDREAAQQVVSDATFALMDAIDVSLDEHSRPADAPFNLIILDALIDLIRARKAWLESKRKIQAETLFGKTLAGSPHCEEVHDRACDQVRTAKCGLNDAIDFCAEFE